MRRFYLFRRNSNNKIYYAQIVNPLTGEKMPAKSTGCTDKDEASFTVMSWLKSGLIPSGDNQEARKAEDVFSIDDIIFKLKNAPLNESDTERIIQVMKNRGYIKGAILTGSNQKKLISFLLGFWTWETSPYVIEKKAYKQSISQNHVDDMRRRIERYWKPYFKPDLSLSDLNREMLREFSLSLPNQKKITRGKTPHERNETLSPRTCNLIIQAGTVALRWAFNNELIQSNPVAGLRKYGVDTKKRGILSDAEMEKLFKSGDWHNNEAARLASLLAGQTGLRIGEIIALRVRDIDKDRIHVLHSFSRTDGLKLPKTGETRQVPVLPETRQQLIDYAKKNPFGYQPDNFIFFQIDKQNEPMRQETIAKRFVVAIESLIGKDERKARNIVFHGLRHYYIKKMSMVIDKRAMMLSGHKSEAVFEGYADHATEEDFQRAIEATSEVFGRVLKFPEDKVQ